MSQFYSQFGQDKYLHEKVFKGFRDGTFVDVGAHDGRSLNNTLFFEENLGWRGVNIEPLRYVYEQLINNRPRCINVNVAIDTEDGVQNFHENQGGHIEMLSGLVKHYHPKHTERLKNDWEAHGGTSDIIKVRTRPLRSVLEEHKLTRVHYLSIDVEGAELAVLQSIDFSKVFIDCIEFECNYEDCLQPILTFLTSKGYRRLPETRNIDIFMIHEKSQFL